MKPPGELAAAYLPCFNDFVADADPRGGDVIGPSFECLLGEVGARPLWRVAIRLASCSTAADNVRLNDS